MTSSIRAVRSRDTKADVEDHTSKVGDVTGISNWARLLYNVYIEWVRPTEKIKQISIKSIGLGLFWYIHMLWTSGQIKKVNIYSSARRLAITGVDSNDLQSLFTLFTCVYNIM